MSRTRASAVVSVVSVVGLVAMLAGSASLHGGAASVQTFDWTATWEPQPEPLPPDRIFAATTFMPRTCEMLSYGGTTPSTAFPVSDTLIYDPSLNEWTILPRQKGGGPRALSHATLTWDADHDVAILFGGVPFYASNPATFGFDPTTRRWTTLIGNGRCKSCPADRFMHAQTWSTALGATLVFGGQGYDANGPVVFGDMWALKAVPGRRGRLTWTWSRLIPQAGADTPVARYAHGIAEIPDGSGRILIYGGWDQAGQALSDTWLYDPMSNTYEQISTDPPTARTAFAMGYLPSPNAIVIQGGQTNPTSEFMVYAHETWAFDHLSRTWVRLTTNGEPEGDRAFHDLASNTCDSSALMFDQPVPPVTGEQHQTLPTWVLR